MKILVKLLVISYCLLISVVTSADQKALENALAKAQYMMRQVSAEKAELQKEKDALSKEISQLKKGSERQARKSEKNNQAIASKFSKLSVMYEELYEKHIALAKLGRQQEMQSNQLMERMESLADKHDLCIANNKQLYSMNEGLASKFKKKGFIDIIKRNEPFTGIAKVEMENLLQGYAYDREGLLLTDFDYLEALASQ